ncbi:MAG TPA: GNAT family N-acetyltransferase [Chitinophagaceae bacterium]|jgi:GNAT superfamily N-acetyltransferase|nr:GNAT family N-acetyltransferase [Chitinophagaceae bacterium]
MIETRKATLEDIDKLAPLFDLYRMFYRQTSDVEGCKHFLTERLTQNQSVILIATDEEDDIVGFIQFYPLFSSVGLQKTWLLNDVYVREKKRKRGIGKTLLNAAKLFGKETGAAWLLLQTANDNYIAQIVYEKNGWERMEDMFYQLNILEGSQNQSKGSAHLRAL